MDDHRNDSRILGDINPTPDHIDSEPQSDPDLIRDRESSVEKEQGQEDESMNGGSQQGSTTHSGSRDVTEGVTGGTGTETGGTRNYRTGTGATGGDIGNRPE